MRVVKIKHTIVNLYITELLNSVIHIEVDKYSSHEIFFVLLRKNNYLQCE